MIRETWASYILEYGAGYNLGIYIFLEFILFTKFKTEVVIHNIKVSMWQNYTMKFKDFMNRCILLTRARTATDMDETLHTAL